jgi:hypothetical protein
MIEIFEDIENYKYEENTNEIVYESDCVDIISLNKNAYFNNTLKSILPALHKLLINIDENNKLEVHKLISVNILEIKKFKSVSLLPCHASIFYLYKNNNCSFTDFAIKLLFNIRLSSLKINKVGKILSNDNNFEYSEKIDSFINGWCYVIFRDDFLNMDIKNLVYRIYLYNLKNDKNNIPVHFKPRKNIDVIMYIVLHYLKKLLSDKKNTFKILIDVNKLNYIKKNIKYKKIIEEYENILFENIINHNTSRILFLKNVISQLK